MRPAAHRSKTFRVRQQLHALGSASESDWPRPQSSTPPRELAHLPAGGLGDGQERSPDVGLTIGEAVRHGRPGRLQVTNALGGAGGEGGADLLPLGLGDGFVIFAELHYVLLWPR